MARNDPSAYGTDLLCVEDISALADEVEGVELVAQDAIHVLTTDDFLSLSDDENEGVGRGYNVQRLLGMKDADLPGVQPILVGVLQEDDRIDAAEVTIESVVTKGIADVRVDVVGYTAQGPFRFSILARDLTVDTFGALQ